MFQEGGWKDLLFSKTYHKSSINLYPLCNEPFPSNKLPPFQEESLLTALSIKPLPSPINDRLF